ncbi:type II secretion system F family protein [Prosthecobacter dejongeii]|uniref:Type II secretory pathway component PulF n=1 Tax=Prosthecobacter dejongeii TaxID=48465 RepID=A0A7W8DPU2_9BACT|nr:type II secretion system F family protein [Prosthecobacter dejongeii]MBB5037999.1 type II secretory pathway component PulF [Prosthecobacter dejongeii]
MPTFSYSAHGPSGVITGQLAASDRAEAMSLLGKQRLQPFKLEQAGAAATVVSRSSAPVTPVGPLRLKLAQVLLFTEELSDLLGAGIQLEPALATMERRRELSGVKTLASVLRTKVRDGMPFSKAVAATSPSFGHLFCALATAGEASGTLPHILRRQVAYLRSLAALRSKVAFALIYPAFLVVAAVSVTLLFIVYLIPKLTELLDSTGGSLPLGAQIILKFSDLFKATWWMLGLAGVGLFIVVKAWLKRPDAQVPWARFLLRLPLFGNILKARFYVQFLETMSNLLGSGLPMVQAMQLTHQAIENPYFQKEFEGVMRHVGEGVSLSRALDRSAIFPPLLLDMVSVGEQTGDLSTALAKAAERFDRELAQKVEKLSAMVQPLIVCLMAGMVGIMAYLMITTIFQTISGMSQ